MTASRRHIPQRKCVACGRRAAQASLLRLAVDPRGLVVPDPRRRLPGRGAYVCGEGECLRKLVRDPRRGRLFHRPLAELAWAELERG